jgi:hypothetical protein
MNFGFMASESSFANTSDDYCRGINQPYPNFNTPHKCRNFEKVLDWGIQNAVKIPGGHVSRSGSEIDLPEGP